MGCFAGAVVDPIWVLIGVSISACTLVTDMSAVVGRCPAITILLEESVGQQGHAMESGTKGRSKVENNIRVERTIGLYYFPTMMMFRYMKTAVEKDPNAERLAISKRKREKKSAFTRNHNT